MPAAKKEKFDIEVVLERVRAAVAGFPAAAMFELAKLGHATVFEQLVGCIISIRTYDEVTLPTALRLLKVANTPAQLATLSIHQIDSLISDCTYHEAKAPQLHAIAERIVKEFGGVLPADEQVLTSFHGVGPKCANLALGVATGQARISVDIHVHRIANRWGYVTTKTPEKTMTALEAKLPKAHWVEINKLLVPFGKARLHRDGAEMLDVSRAPHVPAGRRDQVALNQPRRAARAVQ